VGMAASVERPLGRRPRVKVFWRVGAHRGVGGCRAGNHQGRGRALPVQAHQLEGPCGQGPHAVFAPLALADPHQQALGGDGRDLERGPFPETQATGREQPPTPRGFRACGRGQQGAACWRTQHAGALVAVPGPSEGDERPRARQGALREDPEAKEVEAEGPRGDLLVMEQRPTVLAEVLCAAVVWRQWLDSGARTRLGLGGEPASLQVCKQTAAKCRQGPPPVRVESDPSPTVDTHTRIAGSSPGGQQARKLRHRRDHSAAYRAALSFNS
jgi:hypothetical protein